MWIMLVYVDHGGLRGSCMCGWVGGWVWGGHAGVGGCMWGGGRCWPFIMFSLPHPSGVWFMVKTLVPHPSGVWFMVKTLVPHPS